MLMGISTQLTDSSRSGVVVIALMFVAGYLVFRVAAKKNAPLLAAEEEQ